MRTTKSSSRGATALRFAQWYFDDRLTSCECRWRKEKSSVCSE